MFILFSLATLTISANENAGKIVTLTSSNWDKYIEQRDPDSVWLIMFSGEKCPACKITMPAFTKAASQADGMINFGVVISEKDPGLHMRFQIRVVPTFIIIHKGGRVDYTGKRTDRSFINAASKFIPDHSIPVTKDWVDDETYSAILFTDKEKTPPMWAAVSCSFHSKIRIGITSDPEILELFNVEKTPTIIFTNKTHRITYTGRNTFNAISQSVSDFIDGSYEEPIQFNIDFFLPEEYTEECENFNGYCIIHASAELDPKLRVAQEKYSSNRLKFFYGDEDLPFEFIKPNELYIIAPHKKEAMKVQSVNELKEAIMDVFDGNAKWTPIEELESANK
ncbi:Thioredoxin family protein [Histomonas meleagridis]|uniref:Thioredoxin family protein n=1 Tax=Histomonas meleagridis TaxID=135588 RepID=UPI00355A22B8|nr:Thioredoxin family protein [Histomonas meleagridis]KAH0800722.1 Thioredoxin family protein [Histomonas meleagridis]